MTLICWICFHCWTMHHRGLPTAANRESIRLLFAFPNSITSSISTSTFFKKRSLFHSGFQPILCGRVAVKLPLYIVRTPFNKQRNDLPRFVKSTQKLNRYINSFCDELVTRINLGLIAWHKSSSFHSCGEMILEFPHIHLMSNCKVISFFFAWYVFIFESSMYDSIVQGG